MRDSAQINSTMLDTLSSDYYSISDSGLIAYYRMDLLDDLGINGDGTDDLRDLSVNGNHLDTYGNPTVDQSGAFIVTNVEQTSSEIPQQFYLSQNYQNPFNPSTNIKFRIADLPDGKAGFGFVSLKVYDVLGNEVVTLVNEEKPAGEYEVEFSVTHESFRAVTSGVYFYQLKTESFIQTKKMLLIK